MFLRRRPDPKKYLYDFLILEKRSIITLLKRTRYESKKLTDSAKGEHCTINLPRICNYNPETTVPCHIPDETGTGKMAGKSDDWLIVYGCSECHAVIDGRVREPVHLTGDWYLFYTFRAYKRTLRRMIDKGLIGLP